MAAQARGAAQRAMRGVAERGMTRVYLALRQAAEEARDCPSNRELCDAVGIDREARVTRILATLRGRRLIDIEWSAADAGARRVVIRATGRMTGWSRRGPVPAAAPVEDDEAALRIADRDGMRAFGQALKRSGGRFHDIGTAEARCISSNTPSDPGLPEKPAPGSYMSGGLGGLVRSPRDETEEPFIERRR